MKSVYKKTIIITGIVIVISIFAILTMTYIFRMDSPVVISARKVLHLPAIIVDGKLISLSEIEKNTASIKQFYENQDFSAMGIRIDFNTEDGNKKLKMQERKMINKLVEDVAIEQIAQDWDITISDEAVEIAMERPMAEVGSKDDVKKRLKTLYNWSLDDFGKKVVRGQLLRERVSAKFEEENTATEEMLTKINEAKKELDDGRTFGDVARKYSDGVAASEGGVMGWFSDGQLQDAIGRQIFKMEKGEYTDMIETPLGVHIVKVDEVEEQDGQNYVHVSQIILKKQTFVDYLSNKIKMMKVGVFLPQYKWNPASGMIIFAEEDMAAFEKEVYENAQSVTNELLGK